MTRSVSYPAPSGAAELAAWTPPNTPVGDRLKGRYTVLEALDAHVHAEELFASYAGHDQVWDYLPYGPFSDLASYSDWVSVTVAQPEHLFYAIRNLETGALEGVASYLRINPASGSIEVGHINFSPSLQQTRAATEALYLMMCWAFDAGYRRFEWKCDASNIPSRRAAQRLGFSYEGVFRQATVVKQRNRDTAWFAVIDAEWPALRTAFLTWLSPANFEGSLQKARLSALTRTVRVSTDPLLRD
ncbi:MAG: GNAT family protein [Pseudomonadota bacterium]